MTDTVSDRVDRGIALLDATIPAWEERVTLPELSLSSMCNCVLGQVFAVEAKQTWTDGFDYGVEYLAEVIADDEDARFYSDDHEMIDGAYYGFDALPTYDRKINRQDFAELQAEWEKRIAARQAQ